MKSLPARFLRRLRRISGLRSLTAGGPNPELDPCQVDFRQICHDAIEARRRAPGLRYLMEVPFSRLRDMHPVVLAWPSNPFVLTSQALLEDDGLRYPDSPLCSYFSHVAPENAAIVVGGSSAPLRAMRGLEADLPWKAFGAPALARKMERAIRQARENGAELSLDDGDYCMGPVSVAKGELELRRIRDVLRSIRLRGYHPFSASDHINGFLMEDGETWALMIDSGTHRAAVLFALGHTSVPVLIKPNRTVRRSDVDRWSNVQNGLITRDEALAAFDRVLNGHDPEWLEDRWPPETRQRPALGASSEERRAAPTVGG